MRMRTPVFAACLAVLALAAASARGQSQDEQKALEKKIEALEKQQAEMQRQLEELKKELSARAAAPSAAPTPAPAPTPPPAPARETGPVTSPGLTPFPVASWGETGQVTSGTTFNPAISVVAEGLYYADDRKGLGMSLFPQSDNFLGDGRRRLPRPLAGLQPRRDGVHVLRRRSTRTSTPWRS